MISDEKKTNSIDDLYFHSLSPKIDKQSHKHYCDALEWAVVNSEKEDIKNIALTGSYGSGKSSILKTFEDRKIKGLEFLKISLATFKDEKSNNKSEKANQESVVNLRLNGGEAVKGDKAEEEGKIVEENLPSAQLQLIELSILQQILYHEKNEAIPNSRFKKIRSISRKEILYNSILVLILISSFYTFFHFEDLKIHLSVPEPKEWFRYLILIISLIVFLGGFFITIKKLISVFQKLTVIKLNFQNLEIQINENLDKSILNAHIDEILYFFEVTKYNVVIIEDLDRFEQTEIFTKLREINLLINNSKSVGRRVVFIYAVRDQIFSDSDRTKFFDFIIPVIPVVSHSNSHEKLKEALSVFNYKLSKDLINQVSFYIDDMRLLYNSVNEFHIYFQKFRGKTNQGSEFKDKLFAIIIYKNLYPKDFFNLSKNSGTLYSYLNDKKLKWIENQAKDLREEKLTLKNKLDASEEEFFNHIQDLNKIYLFEYLKALNNLDRFKISNNEYTINNLIESEDIEPILNSKNLQFHPNNNYYGSPVNINFNDVEREIDKHKSYKERRENIKNKARANKIRMIELISHIDIQIKNIKSLKIQTLLKNAEIQLPNNSKQDQLIMLLLRNGYIAEDYLDFISYFYEGDITEVDRWFLMNIKNEIRTEFNYGLNKVENVIEEISDIDFERHYVLNFKILDFLIENEKFITKRRNLLSQLANESEISFDFIKAYIERGINNDKFISHLCEFWKGIWRFLDGINEMTDAEKEIYYYLILNNADIDNLQEIETNLSMKSFIENKNDFLEKIANVDKLKEIIKDFDVRFSKIDFKYASESINEYIYSNNHYDINPQMIELMMRHFGTYNEKSGYSTPKYTTIPLQSAPVIPGQSTPL